MTRRNELLCLFSLLVLLAGAAGLAAADEKSTVKPDPAIVRKLVEQLSSDDFDTREKATTALSKFDEVPDVLRAALKSEDAETRRRARSAVDAITNRLEEKAFQAMVADLQKVEVDRFVHRMVEDADFSGDQQWEIVQKLTKAVTARANELGGKKFKVPDLDMKSLPQQHGFAPNETAVAGKRLLLNDPNKRATSVRGCVILSAAALPPLTILSDSIVIVDGDFTRCTRLDNCVLIVRGKVGSITLIRNSIILATDECKGANGCEDSFYQVSNPQLRFTTAANNVYVKSTAVTTRIDTSSRVLGTERGPLQLLKFSDKKDLKKEKNEKK